MIKILAIAAVAMTAGFAGGYITQVQLHTEVTCPAAMTQPGLRSFQSAPLFSSEGARRY